MKMTDSGAFSLGEYVDRTNESGSLLDETSAFSRKKVTPEFLIEKREGLKTPIEHFPITPYNIDEVKRYGFSKAEVIDLKFSLSVFLYPRVVRLKEISSGYPFFLTEEKWNEILDKIAFALKRVIETNNVVGVEKEPAVEEGFELLREYLDDLWT